MSEKKRGIIKGQLVSYKRYWMYKSSTKGIVQKNIGPLSIKELFKTYKSLKEPEISFQRSMEREGIVESDLGKAHMKYNIVQILFFVISLYPFYLAINLIIDKISGVESTIGFLPSIIIPVVSFSLILFYYLFFNWIQWRIRNKALVLPRIYFKIILKYPSQILPIYSIKDNMVELYGENWFNKVNNDKKDYKNIN